MRTDSFRKVPLLVLLRLLCYLFPMPFLLRLYLVGVLCCPCSFIRPAGCCGLFGHHCFTCLSSCGFCVSRGLLRFKCFIKPLAYIIPQEHEKGKEQAQYIVSASSSTNTRYSASTNTKTPRRKRLYFAFYGALYRGGGFTRLHSCKRFCARFCRKYRAFTSHRRSRCIIAHYPP